MPTKYGLRLNSEAKYFDLKRKLASLCYLNPNFMLICEVWNSQIRHSFPDEDKIKPSSAKELYVYQLPEECNDRSRSSSTLGINIEKGLKDIQRSSGNYIKKYLILKQKTITFISLSLHSINSHVNCL